MLKKKLYTNNDWRLLSEHSQPPGNQCCRRLLRHFYICSIQMDPIYGLCWNYADWTLELDSIIWWCKMFEQVSTLGYDDLWLRSNHWRLPNRSVIQFITQPMGYLLAWFSYTFRTFPQTENIKRPSRKSIMRFELRSHPYNT